jgi:protein TonB
MIHDGSIHATNARDMRLGSAVSLLLHAALLLLIGLAVTHSRATFTAPAVQTMRLEVELPLTTPTANTLVTSAAAPVDAPVPQTVAPPRPALPATIEERLTFTETPQDAAPAAPDSVAPDRALAGDVTTLVATESITKRLFGSDTADARDTLPAAPTAPTAPTGLPVVTGNHRTGAPQAGAISLRKELQPPYPLGARQRGEEGTVVLETTVTAEGTPTRVSVISSSGFADLDHAARKALQRAGFHPATEDGRPVEARAHITIVFRLTN